MNDRTACATSEALVTYLYEECEPTERESIAAHVAICASCAEEVQALGDTRAHLASWSPPSLSLGFQITRTDSDQPTNQEAGRVLRPARWWSQPLPAWAQMAAAVAIFAAGMSVSAYRSPGEQANNVVDSSTVQTASPVAARRGDDLSVTRADFARIEARLRAVESADAYRASYQPRATASLDDNDIHARLSALEERLGQNEGQNVQRFAALARAVEANMRDMDTSREVAQKFTRMEEEVNDHRQVLTAVVPGLAVRTSLTSGGR